ncbi:hypothetical protein ACFO4O_08885 [Glaciecola siphonariae]|uniref:Uncharacterized protein n=1 Tax=Glaciecola siphonariae TaxID=521012 RepID=A0ABV9LX63_9ALTE
MIAMFFRFILVLVMISAVAFTAYLDRNRAGPISELEKCSLLLSRVDQPPADILILGSSRVGVAIDPVAMAELINSTAQYDDIRVECIAVPIAPLRTNVSLLEQYINVRGAAQIVVFEPSFLSKRSFDNLKYNLGESDPEQYIFTRDINFMTYSQIWNMPGVAMPFSRGEDLIMRLHLKLRGFVLRTGLLIYEFLHDPFREWSLESCNTQSWRVGGMDWSSDFTFIYAHSRHTRNLEETHYQYKARFETVFKDMPLADWQNTPSEIAMKPSDLEFEADYRLGEVKYLHKAISLVQDENSHVIVLPMMLYNQTLSDKDRLYLEILQSNPYDIFAETDSLLAPFWYNEAHVKPRPAGEYATILLSRHIVNADVLSDAR